MPRPRTLLPIFRESHLELTWETVEFDDLDGLTLYTLLRVRQEVFVMEQESIYLDLDGKDLDAVHMLCREGRSLVAYQRCLPPGLSYPESSLGRIVVAPGMRGRQLGRDLVQRGIDHNLARWPGHGICISAQSHLQDFYTSMGFTAEGEVYQEDGIPHRKMRYPA